MKISIQNIFFMLLILAIPFHSYGDMSLKLKWLPSIDLEELDWIDNTELMKKNFKLEINDLRTTGKEVGSNIEARSHDKAVTTETDIMSWLKNRFTFCLSNYGFIFNESNLSDYTIRFDIIEYYVTEDNMYKGKLKAKVYLKNKEEILWEDIVVGKSSPWGKSYSKENYLNVLSNVIIDATKVLLKDTPFLSSFEKKTPAKNEKSIDI
ncbi:MAG TPA: hypothetical protein VHO70_21880 [Chitinispirillaceae bacterium]|nr:hypothetical protein [Chitinispirillaceae bacterium]